MGRHIIGHVSELPPGERRVVDAEGRSIGIFNVSGQYYALRNQCPHQGAPLCLAACRREHVSLWHARSIRRHRSTFVRFRVDGPLAGVLVCGVCQPAIPTARRTSACLLDNGLISPTQPWSRLWHRFRLNARQTSHPAPAAAISPRSENWRNPHPSLRIPITGSTVHFRRP